MRISVSCKRHLRQYHAAKCNKAIKDCLMQEADRASSTLYAAALLLPSSFNDVVSVALQEASGRWFYVEAADLDLSRVSDSAERRAIESKLRCVPNTTFVQQAEIGSALLRFLQAVRGEGPLTIRVGSEITRKVLQPMLMAAASSEQVDLSAVTWRTCRFSNTSLDSFYRKSGWRRGAAKPAYQHSLVDALGLAVCDLDRCEAMDVERIHHLEMVLGSKGAAGYRAWGRVHEATRPRRPASVPHAVAA